MRLKKITYNNFKQHRDLTLPLAGNVIGIVGQNGNGKSNAIGGLQFGFTGEQPGFNKSELTTWGEVKGGVTIEFTHNGTLFTLERSTSSNHAKLTYEKEEVVGITQVNQRLASLVGIDADLMKQSVFVNQSEIDAVLFSLPAERELAFQKLLGIGTAAKTYDQMGILISGLSKPTDYTTMTNTLVANIDTWLQLAESAKAALVECQGKLGKFANFDPSTEKILLEALLEESKKIAVYRAAEARFMNASAAFSAASAGTLLPVEEIPADMLTKLQTAYDFAKGEYASAELLWKQCQDYTQSAAELAKVKGESSIVLGFKPKVIEMETQLEQAKVKQAGIRQAMSNATAEHQSIKALVLAASKAKSSGVSGSCPLCGSAVTEVSQDKMDRYAALDAELLNLQMESDNEGKTITDLTNAISSYKMQIMRMETTLSAYEAKVASYQNAHVLGNTVLCKQTLQGASIRLAKATTDLETGRQKISDNNSRMQMNATQIASRASSEACLTEARQTMETALALCKEALESGVDIEATIQSTKAMLAEYDAMKVAEGKLLADLKVYTHKLNGLQVELTDIQAKRDAQASYVAKLETLNRVRNWFHYKNGPHAVVVDVMKRLTPNVNFFLEKLGAPFCVVADYDTVGFRYMMTNGTVNPDELPTAKSLSGAQRNMLAMAFRLSCYCMFASKLGILVLDEPTAHLDNNNVGKFGELLQRVQVMAAEMNLQILVVTHHLEILSFCDSTISIGNDQKVKE